MKRILVLVIALVMVFVFAGCKEEEPELEEEPALERKPVIYLYPEERTEVTVELDFDGKLTSTYPEYKSGWKVIAEPDGTLYDESGREYYCLFWEGISDTEYDFSTGFTVPGGETAAFLEKTLAEIGLTEKEANEFIIYWLPQMEHNAYNLISFQTDVYEDTAKLEITPEPDSLLRVFMVWKPVEKPAEIEPQTFEPFIRKGFTAIEWGGAKVN